MGDAARSARKYGLKFGVYLSPWDRHEPKYQEPAAYDAYYLAELEELAQNYGDLVEFWLDGAGSAGHVYNFPKIIETLRTYQPNTIVFADTALFEYGDARWVGTESGNVGYENWSVIDRHGYLRWRPIEADTPLRKEHWFWHPNDEASLKSPGELLDTYDHTIGRGAQLMLGVAPDDRGLIPEADVERLKQFGDAIEKRYRNNLALRHTPVSAEVERALDGDAGTFWSAPPGSHHSTIELNFGHPETMDTAVTMEWLAAGQNVQAYRIEAWVDGKWKSIFEGQAIGHRKIDRFAPVTAERVRLNIISSADGAFIREFELFDSGNRTLP